MIVPAPVETPDSLAANLVRRRARNVDRMRHDGESELGTDMTPLIPAQRPPRKMDATPTAAPRQWVQCVLFMSQQRRRNLAMACPRNHSGPCRRRRRTISPTSRLRLSLLRHSLMGLSAMFACAAPALASAASPLMV